MKFKHIKIRKGDFNIVKVNYYYKFVKKMTKKYFYCVTTQPKP